MPSPIVRRLSLVASLAAVLAAAPRAAHAYGSGYPEYTDCNSCHSGGPSTTTVTFEGLPQVLTAGETVDFSVNVTNPSLRRNGFSLTVNGGTLTARSGAGLVQPKACSGGAANCLSHSARSDCGANGCVTKYAVRWVAPTSGGTFTFRARGNGVNGDGSSSGDRPSSEVTHAIAACNSNQHICGTTCASNSSPQTCGTSCTPCPGITNGTATCSNGACGLACNAGFHMCPSGSCEANNDATKCGPSCTTCPPVANGTAICVNGTTCSASCNAGFALQNGQCVPATNVGCCGASCTVCPASPANGTAACVAGACTFSCDVGFHKCGNGCRADDDVDACGTSCAACPGVANADRVCTAGACSFTCKAGFNRCGDACKAEDDVTACGASCTACPTDPNGQTTCTAGQCGKTCNAGFLDCGGTMGCVAEADHTFFSDGDGDGYGSGTGTAKCEGASGEVKQAGDCDDGDAQVSPGVEELCNGVDDDCDGERDEGNLCPSGKVCAGAQGCVAAAAPDAGTEPGNDAGLVPAPQPVPEEETQGCGCGAGGASPLLALGLLGSVLLRRRRRAGS
ncbi:MAG: choice-of-anchor V domain-containing protein [Myxococcales bacterium]